MKFSVITLFPEFIESHFAKGVVGQANVNELIQVECLNPRSFTQDVHKTVDDRPYGGGDGMIMLAEPLVKSIEALKMQSGASAKVIYLSPQGARLTDKKVKSLSQESHLILLCGRYGGIDQRVINQCVDEEISIGDYVLSGGELAAAVIIDAVARKIPGVLGNQNSSEQDSFSNQRLEEPSFTRPREFMGQSVPEILLSGNHLKIQQWRERIKDLVTLKKRPDLLAPSKLNMADLKKFWQELSVSEKKSLGLETFPETTTGGSNE